MVPPSIYSHNPQQLPPCKLSEEHLPTFAYMVMRGSLKCHCLFAIPPPPKKKNGEPGKSLAFSLLRISVSTVELDYSSSWPINEQENLRELELVLQYYKM